jgi:hypothetical protein
VWSPALPSPTFDPSTALTETQQAVLIALAETDSITQSARLAGTQRQRISEWRSSSELFAEEEKRAYEFYKDRLRAEIRRRVFEGQRKLVLDRNSRPVFINVSADGEVVPEGDPRAVKKVALWETKKSDNMLMFEAKKTMPEYRDNPKVVINQNGAGGTEITPDQIVLAMDGTVPSEPEENEA